MIRCLETIDNIELKVKSCETSEKIELISRVVFILARLSFIGVTLPLLAVTAVNYFVYDLKDEPYFLIIPLTYVLNWTKPNVCSQLLRVFAIYFLSLPFDWKTHLGYFLAFTFYAAAIFALSYCSIPPICLTIGASMFSSLFLDHIIDNIHHLDKLTKKPHKHQLDMRNLLCSITQDFSKAKQFGGL